MMRIFLSIRPTYMFIGICATCAVVFSAGLPVSAQQAPAGQATSTPYVLLTVNPLDPAPGDTVTASLVAATFNMQEASISWFLNGVLQNTASSSPVFTFKAPDTQTGYVDVTASVVTGGQQIQKSARIVINVLGTNSTDIYQNLINRLQTLQNKYGPDNAPLFPSSPAGDLAAGGSSSSFSIISDIQNPRPFDTVTLHIESATFNTDQSRVQWFQNGKKVLDGPGQSVLPVQLGALGSSTDIRVVVSAQGQTYESSLMLIPFSTSLYWWADTSVPYWYRGKSLATQNNLVYVSAFVPTGVSQPKNITYQWTLNGEPQPLASGTDKQTFSFRPRLPGLSDTVSVRISNANGSLAFEQSVTIPNVPPEVHFCIVDLIAGCSRGVSFGTVRGGDAIDIRAFPFYFGTTESKFVTYGWSIGGNAPTTPATTQPQLLTIKPPANVQGTVSVHAALQSLIGVLNAASDFTLGVQ